MHMDGGKVQKVREDQCSPTLELELELELAGAELKLGWGLSDCNIGSIDAILFHEP